MRCTAGCAALSHAYFEALFLLVQLLSFPATLPVFAFHVGLRARALARCRKASGSLGCSFSGRKGGGSGGWEIPGGV